MKKIVEFSFNKLKKTQTCMNFNPMSTIEVSTTNRSSD